MPRLSPRSLGVLAAAGAASLGTALVPGALAGASPGTAPGGSVGLTARVVLAGNSLSHTFTVGGVTKTEPLSSPDDITLLGHDIFTGFQNGVGPQGQASSSGNVDSTVVEFTLSGKEVAQWDVAGKTDGVTADPDAGYVVATANEDANSSLYTITPGAASPVHHYNYNKPLPHNGGTDAIEFLDGRMIISASAPGTTGTLPAPQPTFPAAYWVSLNPTTSIATVHAAFYDEAPARVANVNAPNFGHNVRLMLTDPDSNEVVPANWPRFGGEFMLTSQGDEEQIFLGNPFGPFRTSRDLSVLKLTQSVDDTAFSTAPGVLYATDSTNDNVDLITGTFPLGAIAAATPCGQNAAPATCPAPPMWPANYLASLNDWTGQVTRLLVGGAPFVPQGGLLYIPFNTQQGQNQQGQNQQ